MPRILPLWITARGRAFAGGRRIGFTPPTLAVLSIPAPLRDEERRIVVNGTKAARAGGAAEI